MNTDGVGLRSWSMQPLIGCKRSRTSWVAVAVAVVTLVLAPSAHAAFGDTFDLADVNVSGVQSSAAYPGEKVWWAGVCNTSSTATDVGVAPAVRQNCIDWGETNRQCPSGLACSPQAPSTPDVWVTGSVPSWRLAGDSQAGGHPDGSATFAFSRSKLVSSGEIKPDGSVDNILVDLPPGFVGNPGAVPKCTQEEFSVKPVRCLPETQVGISTLVLDASLGGVSEQRLPVYNLEPRNGYTAEFGIPDAGDQSFTPVRIVAEARSNSDFGVTAGVVQVPAALALYQQAITLWAVPWSEEYDKWRTPKGALINSPECVGGAQTISTNIPAAGLTSDCQRPYSPSWGPIRPFFSNITGPADGQEACDGTGSEPNTRVNLDIFEKPGAFDVDGFPDLSDPDWITADSPAPALDGCEQLGFEPDISLARTTTAADSPTGLDVTLTIPQNNDPPVAVAHNPSEADGAPAYWRDNPTGLATAHLKDTTVTLPEGTTLNPAAAGGLASCTTAQIGLKTTSGAMPNPIRFSNAPVQCPDASKVGTLEIDTPLLEEEIPGEVYIAAQADNPFGSDFAIYLVAHSEARNVMVKLAGKVEADPVTGKLTTTFLNNPQLPFSTFELHFLSGQRAPLATSPLCGSPSSVSRFTSWAAPGAPVSDLDPLPVSSSPAGGCPTSMAQRPFAIGLSAGTQDAIAGSYSPLHARFTRGDGNQEFDRIELSTPKGFAGKLAGIARCSEAGIARAIGRTETGDGAVERRDPSCPAASQVGTTTIGAGAGSRPFYTTGNAYLAGPYRGAPLSLAFVVPAVAGPFDLGVQVVRAAVHVNDRTAQITTVSDAIPKILRGVPLRIQDIRVDIDRSRFTINPTDCSEKQVTGRIFSSHGGLTPVSNRFQVADCAALPFKPKLALRLTGRKQVRTGKHPGVRAQVTQMGIGEAGIERAEVRLPKSLALDVDNAQALCEFEDGTKPDLENHCPKGSIVGRARAVTPLLDDPLVGNVYFVKNVRRDPKTGNVIRTLPMIIAALRGEIAINLVGTSDVKGGKLVSTFDEVPDAPVSRFNLNINGGRNGILAVTRTRRALIHLCAKPRGHIAESDMDGHNGKRHDRDIRMKTPCSRKQSRAAKRWASANRR